MLRRPGLARANANLAMLEDAVQSTKEVCNRLAFYINHANTLPDDQLPLEVPLIFYGQQMHLHPHDILGSFEYVQKDDDTGVVVIPYGRELDGTPIVKPPATPATAFPIVPPPQAGQPDVLGGAPGGAWQVDPSVLINGMLAALQAMADLNLQADARNAAMARQ